MGLALLLAIAAFVVWAIARDVEYDGPSCRECGCTETDACVLIVCGKRVTTCGWVEEDLCTACAPAELERESSEHYWLHPGAVR